LYKPTLILSRRYLYELAQRKYGSGCGADIDKDAFAADAAAARLECQSLRDESEASGACCHATSSATTTLHSVNDGRDLETLSEAAASSIKVSPGWVREALAFDSVEAWFHEVRPRIMYVVFRKELTQLFGL